MKTNFAIAILFFAFICFNACEDPVPGPNPIPEPEDCSKYTQTAYQIKYPSANWAEMIIPEDNPMTNEGVQLGRMLFWDPILSKDSTISCASCHAPNNSFTDSDKFSEGVDGNLGTRNSMALVNLGWQQSFFWDGRAATLEEQILEPVPNPIEMHLEWKDAITRLNRSERYNEPIKKAFSICEVDSTHVTKAIAQFLRTMISGNSKYDKVRFQQTAFFTDEELYGFDKFFNDDLNGHCHHCHSATEYLLFEIGDQFKNNGIDGALAIEDFTDTGLGGFTNNPKDFGLFKAPTLRNIELTAPYMHDGRFNTLDEVIDHYVDGVKNSPTLSPIMITDFVQDGGLVFSEYDKQALKAFLLTLTDWEFVNDTSFQSPF